MFSEHPRRGLNYGRNKRTEKLRYFKEEIPKISDLLFNNQLDLKKWFEKYIFLLMKF